MTQPAPSPALTTAEQLSGRAAEAIADMHDELRRRYSGLNAAEAQLAEVLLTAQAANDTGRARLQDIQRQLVEAIASPVNALDTPAGERQFLLFLRGKIAEIQRVVDDGELTARDQAELAVALGSAYLADPVLDSPRPAPAASQPAQATPAAAMSPSPAMGGLPQMTTPTAPSSGLGTAASPLAGLASLLSGQPREESIAAPPPELPEKPGHEDVPTADDEARESDDDEDADAAPEDAPVEDPGPAETRPAAN